MTAEKRRRGYVTLGGSLKDVSIEGISKVKQGNDISEEKCRLLKAANIVLS